MIASIKLIESETLSNGDTFRITKLGRYYGTSRLFIDDQAPECDFELSKSQAYAQLESALRDDVLELD